MAARVVVITGANRGLGLETARQVAVAASSAGRATTLCLTARDAAKGEAACRAVSSADGVDASTVSVRHAVLDAAAPGSAAGLVEHLAAEFGRCDVLVNNAAVYDGGWDEKSYDHVVQVNVRTPVELARGVLPLMYAQGEGRVLNVSSGLGEIDSLPPGARAVLNPSGGRVGPGPAKDFTPLLPLDRLLALRFADFSAAPGLVAAYKPVYSVSKCMLNIATVALQRQAADEFNDANAGKPGVSVIAINPGWCRTDMGGSTAPRSAAKGAQTTSWLAALPGGDDALVRFRAAVVKDQAMGTH